MLIPEKVRAGDKWASLPDKINAIIDCLRQLQPVAGRGIRIDQTPSGRVISSLASDTTAADGEEEEQEQQEEI